MQKNINTNKPLIVPKTLPFGYTRNQNTNEIEINTKESEVIKIIFEMYKNDYGLYQIYFFLQSRGYKTRSNIDFKISTISHLLNNEAFIGNYVYNKNNIIIVDGKKKRVKVPEEKWIKVENIFPPIIDVDTFNKVKEIKAYWNFIIKGDGINE